METEKLIEESKELLDRYFKTQESGMDHEEGYDFSFSLAETLVDAIEKLEESKNYEIFRKLAVTYSLKEV